MENEAVRFETARTRTKGDPLSFIINDMAQNEHLRESNDLAEAIQRSMAPVHPGPEPRGEAGQLRVLRTSFIAGRCSSRSASHQPRRGQLITSESSQQTSPRRSPARRPGTSSATAARRRLGALSGGGHGDGRARGAARLAG
jgi:hypothetical protein